MVKIHLHIHVDPGQEVLARLGALDRRVARLSTQLENHMAKLDDKITELTTDVSEIGTVVDSAVALIGGIAEQVRLAVEAAIAAGATEQQLAAMTALGASLDAKGEALAAAVAANTPAEEDPQPDPSA